MMLISATGNKNPRRDAGFTIAEILIVLALIGLAARAVVLVLPNDQRALAREVETFAARVKAAQDIAVVRNRALFGVVDTFGYRFEEYSGNSWVAFEAQRITASDWSDETQVLLERGARARFELTTLGGLSPVLLEFRRGSARLDLTLTADGSVDIGKANAR